MLIPLSVLQPISSTLSPHEPSPTHSLTHPLPLTPLVEGLVHGVAQVEREGGEKLLSTHLTVWLLQPRDGHVMNFTTQVQHIYFIKCTETTCSGIEIEKHIICFTTVHTRQQGTFHLARRSHAFSSFGRAPGLHEKEYIYSWKSCQSVSATKLRAC